MGVVIVRPIADAELDHHARYLADRNSSAGQRLYDAAQETFAILANAPGLGAWVSSRNPRIDRLRFIGVNGLPMYLIFYYEIPGGIEVVRLLHASQDWAAAIEE